MIALHAREMTGVGQAQVDVSIQEAVVRVSDTTISWDTNEAIRQRGVVEARRPHHDKMGL